MFDAQASALAVQTESQSGGARLRRALTNRHGASHEALPRSYLRTFTHLREIRLRRGLARRSITKAAMARRSTTKAAGRPQGPFKIKNPSQNARKLLKVNKGQLRLYDTPGGLSRFYDTNPPASRRKSPYSQRFHPRLSPSNQVVFYPPKQAIYDRFFAEATLSTKVKGGAPVLTFPFAFSIHSTQHHSPAPHALLQPSLPPIASYCQPSRENKCQASFPSKNIKSLANLAKATQKNVKKSANFDIKNRFHHPFCHVYEIRGLAYYKS